MSHAIAFDTHAFIKTLEESGIEQKQAEAIKKVFEIANDEILSAKIFTKEDGKTLKSEIKEEISKIIVDMHKVKIDILMWVIGILIAQSGLTLAVIKLFH
jgi:hypothetical protein